LRWRGARQAEPVNFADHGISCHISEFRGNLAGRKSGFPELLQLLDAIVGPGQYRHRILPFALRGPIRNRRRCGLKSPKSLAATIP
jgi:hypothetical protein